MASVHQRPETKYWYAAWRGDDGRLNLRSTKLTDHNKAMAMALEWERADRMAAQGNLVESQAREVLNDIMKRVGGDAIRAPAVSDFFKGWLTAKTTAKKSAGTITRYQGVVDDFLATIGPKAKLPVTSLVPRDVESFMAKRTRDGCSPVTIKLDVKIVRTVLNSARRQGLITTNPAEAVELPEGESIERGTFTAAEVKMLIDTGEGEWPDLIRLAYFTGQRLGDLCALRWDQVDLAAGVITFKPQKGRNKAKVVVVPVHLELQARLEAMAGIDRPQEYVLPHMSGLTVGGRHGLSEGFKLIVVKAGLDLGTVKGGGDRMVSKRSFHALRHSFVSALANAGVEPELRMKLTGHTSEAIHGGYTHHELESLRAAMGKHPGLEGKA